MLNQSHHKEFEILLRQLQKALKELQAIQNKNIAIISELTKAIQKNEVQGFLGNSKYTEDLSYYNDANGSD